MSEFSQEIESFNIKALKYKVFFYEMAPLARQNIPAQKTPIRNEDSDIILVRD